MDNTFEESVICRAYDVTFLLYIIDFLYIFYRSMMFYIEFVRKGGKSSFFLLIEKFIHDKKVNGKITRFY
jgi:hypothetical protein